MARKSRDRRIADTKQALQRWHDAGVDGGKVVSFMCDMLARLERGKGLSKGQRKWLDDLADSHPPEVPQPELLDQIEEAREWIRDASKKSVLSDFASRLQRDRRRLTEKQEAWARKMIREAFDIRDSDDGNPLDEATFNKLVAAWPIAHWRRRNLNHNQGTREACRLMQGWINRRANGEVDYEAYLELMSSPEGRKEWAHHDWAVGRIIKEAKVYLRELEKPYTQPGNMVWAPNPEYKPWDDTHPSHIQVLVISGPMPSKGKPAYEVMFPKGQPVKILREDLRKRTPGTVKHWLKQKEKDSEN